MGASAKDGGIQAVAAPHVVLLDEAQVVLVDEAVLVALFVVLQDGEAPKLIPRPRLLLPAAPYWLPPSSTSPMSTKLFLMFDILVRRMRARFYCLQTVNAPQLSSFRPGGQAVDWF